MNRLKRDKQRMVIHMLCEGSSIRSTERITRVHRDTICKLLHRTGHHCHQLVRETIAGVHCDELQLDEIWSFVGKKQGRCGPDDPPEFGDQFVFTAIDPITKLLVHHHIGKRSQEATDDFVWELSNLTTGPVLVCTDGFTPYLSALRNCFRGRLTHGQIIKIYRATVANEARYSPPRVFAVDRIPVWGRPRSDRMSTSHVERHNATIRTFVKRMSRLSLCYSKRLKGLQAAFDLFSGWYNFVKIHGSLGMTPGMVAGVTDRLWSIDDLLPER